MSGYKPITDHLSSGTRACVPETHSRQNLQLCGKHRRVLPVLSDHVLELPLVYCQSSRRIIVIRENLRHPGQCGALVLWYQYGHISFQVSEKLQRSRLLIPSIGFCDRVEHLLMLLPRDSSVKVGDGCICKTNRSARYLAPGSTGSAEPSFLSLIHDELGQYYPESRSLARSATWSCR